VDRELSRTLAILADDDPANIKKLIATLTLDSDPIDDVHTLLVLARLPGRRDSKQTQVIADALLRLDEKADSQALARDRHWPIRVSEAAAALVKHDPQLVAQLVKSPLFGRPGHIAFTGISGFDRTAAARRFLSRAANDPDYAWQPQHVALLGELPASEVGETLTMLWDRGGLEDELIPLFARNPTVCDHDKFIVGLRSTRSNTIALAAEAMRKLPAAEDGTDLAALIQVLRMLPVNETTARNEVAATLRLRTGADLEADAQAWAEWTARNRPDVARKLSTGLANIAQTQKRLTRIDWSVGNAENGKKVFARASCASCHNGAMAVGPSLEGVASRFNRDDLLTAIIDPNRDVSSRYRVTQVATDDGKLYQGVVIYEANDGLILQTRATETVRIAGPRVVSKKLLDSSLMPAGLLDPLSDQEIADLFAYIETLGKSKK
jgi:putative heme-binding domain-containing protein